MRKTIVGVWLLLCLLAWADSLTKNEKLAEVKAMIARQTRNIARMKAELKAHPDHPDASLLRDYLATAVNGKKTAAYTQQSPYMRSLIDRFESNFLRNAGGAIVMAAGGASARTQFIVEIDRSNQFISELEIEQDKLIQLGAKEEESAGPATFPPFGQLSRHPFCGRWKSTFGELTLTSTDDGKVTGNYHYKTASGRTVTGQLQGQLKGDYTLMVSRWSESLPASGGKRAESGHGTAELTITGDGKHFEGPWQTVAGDGEIRSGEWKGDKLP